MATIGWIKVGASVDTSQFAKGMQSMAKMTDAFQRSAAANVLIGSKMMASGLAGVGRQFAGLATLAKPGILQVGKAIAAATPRIVDKLGPIRDAAVASVASLKFVYGGMGKVIGASILKTSAPIAAAARASVASLGFVYGPAIRKVGAIVGATLPPIARQFGVIGRGAAVLAVGFGQVGIGVGKMGLTALVPTLGLLTRGIGGAVSLAGRLTASLAAGALKVAAFGAGVATLVAGGMAALVASSIRGVATTEDLANRLGITTQSLQKLGYAAKLSGVDQDLLVTSLEKMEDTLTTAAVEGSGPAADALRRLGLQARELTQLAPDQAFLRLVTALDQVPNAMQKTAIARDIFGKSGSGMINLALTGASAMQKMGLEASAMGVALSGIDNAKLAEADDSLDKIGAAIAGVANQIGVTLAPYITAISDQFIQWMTTGTKTGSYVSQAVDWVTDAVGKLGNSLQWMKDAFLIAQIKITEGLIWMIKHLDNFASGINDILTYFGMSGVSAGDFTKTWLEDLERMKKAQEETFNQQALKTPFSETVRKLKEDIQKGAQQRAEFAVGKGQGIGAPGAPIIPKVMETKLPGAAELGSKEAYSAVVQAKARLMDSKQNLVVTNTGRTAEATNRMAVAMQRMLDMRVGVDGVQYRAAVSGR